MTDRQRIELQIRAVLVAFRVERRRGGTGWTAPFKARARELLDPLDAAVTGHPDLQRALSAARAELGLAPA